jgi:hypothetical protein
MDEYGKVEISSGLPQIREAGVIGHDEGPGLVEDV